ncbi:MAG: metal-dependent hydrolase [Promethearchaeota archaeon]
MDGKTHVIGGVQLFSLFIIILWFIIPSATQKVVFLGFDISLEEYNKYGRIISLIIWLFWLIADQYRIQDRNVLENLKEKRSELKEKIKEIKTEGKKLDTMEKQITTENVKDLATSSKQQKKLKKQKKKHQKELKKQQKKELNLEAKEEKYKKREKNMKKVSYYTTLINVIVLSSTVNLEISNRFGIIIIGYLLAFMGASFPDLDLWISIKSHRNPFTHSAMLPSLMFIYFFFIFNPKTIEAEIIFLFTGFFIGYASHLIFDLYKRGTKFISALFYRESDVPPGDIRHVPSSLERFYLSFGGLTLIFFLILTILRLGVAKGRYAALVPYLGFEPISPRDPIPINALVWLIISISLIIFPLYMLLDNWNRKEEKRKWKSFSYFYWHGDRIKKQIKSRIEKRKQKKLQKKRIKT